MELINKNYQFPFEKLEIWQLALKLSINTKKLIKTFPKEERYGLVDQMRRSSSSVCSNIAEGSVRKKTNDKARFIEIAFGSLMEFMSQSIESNEAEYISANQLVEIRIQVHELSNKINAFYNRLAK